MKNLAVVPARSGSKGLQDKNIRLLGGRPMLVYSIEAAYSSGIFDTIHVSTDSKRYAEIASSFGADVPFLRSAENASDMASSWDVVLEVLEKYERLGKTFDTVALLQPTTPFRTAEDIRQAYRIMWEKNASAVVSICETEYSPLWCNILPKDGCLNGFISPAAMCPRQTLEKYYRINGAIYILPVPILKERKGLEYNLDCFAYVMPQERSVDIDGPLDFMLAEVLMQNQV